MTVDLRHGNCLDVLRTLPDCSVDAVCTDPPYGLADHKPAAVTAAVVAWSSGDREHVPNGKGFMGREWDRFVPPPAVWDECLRVLKPGGHLLAFAGSRTVDLMGLSIRLAGFEIRDSVTWLAGSGFPKSLDVGKAIDKARDDKTEVRVICRWLRARIDEHPTASPTSIAEHFGMNRRMVDHWAARDTDSQPTLPTVEQWEILRGLLDFGPDVDDEVWRLNGRKGTWGNDRADRVIGPAIERQVFGGHGNVEHAGTPVLDAARQWQGWGTALKPASEPIVVARKPLAGTVAANVLAHGTGGLNVDATRVSPPSPAHDEHASGPLSPHGSPRGTGADALAPSPGSAPCTCASPPACSTGGTSPDHESGQPRRTPNTDAPATSDARPGPRTDLPASAQSHALTHPSRPGSPDDCPTSPRSDGEHALTGVGADREASRRPLDAPECPAPHATSGHSPSPSRSTPCPQHTAQHVKSPGRWPTNVVLTHGETCTDRCVEGCPVAELDTHSGITRDGTAVKRNGVSSNGVTGWGKCPPGTADVGYGGQGGASRFFPTFRYQAKAPTSERPKIDGQGWPTVKPLALMRWLVRLVTPPGGLVLDPFAGTGATLQAAELEGFDSLGVELDDFAYALACQRLQLDVRDVVGHPDTLTQEAF